MTDSTVTIEVDGRELQAKAGTMLIEVTDAAGIRIPRFCYHKKLSVAANCRMCLVEVEKVPKPLPACATPVNEGMKVFTRSPRALAAQQGTMEFLLINHPLDCPICDQGGECELQDVAMGYGSDVSRYHEKKRVVADKNIGPLIATDMTRCIHCTRCVRFGQEIAGIREMGATGRGEHTLIGTYIEKSVDSELSGNVIDLCPVGALTSKPFRFSARAWELVQVEGIAPHDSFGSNINLHLRGNKVMRVHPRDNESINESWISDRDRYSYEGLYAADRLTAPLVNKDGEWQEASWEIALEMAAVGLKETGGGEQFGALVSPAATLEELYLAQKLVRGLGSQNIDSRLRQGDFRLDEGNPGVSWLGMAIAEVETLNAALIIGGNLRKEQPLLAHRLRKAALGGADLHYLNPQRLELSYAAKQTVVSPAAMLDTLAAVAKAAGVKGQGVVAELIKSAKADAAAKDSAATLKQADAAAVMLGSLAQSHPDYALIAALASALAESTGARLAVVPAAANSLGAQLAGAVPCLQAGGKALDKPGLDAFQMLKTPRKGYLLMGVEPGLDFWDGALSTSALQSADIVVAVTAYRSPELEACADILLPMGLFAETAGTYVNAEGVWQTSRGAVPPLGEARPGWKVLRVLGNLLDLQGFDYTDAAQITEELQGICNAELPPNRFNLTGSPSRQLAAEALVRGGDTPLYATDPLVRRAEALQQTSDAGSPAIRLHPAEAKRLGLAAADRALVKQNGYQANLPLQLDDSLPEGCAWISTGLAETAVLGQPFGELTLEKA
ncbi:MAG: NADH-quinone oxidoreductase subunit NuoG [Candidatus Thiodiazotropha sp.]